MAQIQKSQWKLALIVVALSLAIIYLLFSDNGVLHVRELKIEKARLETQVFELERIKKTLKQEIEQLQTNPAAMEQVIRENMDMIRQDETLFVFPPKEQTKEP